MITNLDKLTARVSYINGHRARQRAADLPDHERPWYKITNLVDSTDIMIYDEIGTWGTSAGSFVNALRQVTTPTIELHINSPGGEVFDGVAIYTALRNHPATVNVTVDGIAASAASFIAQAGDNIAMEKPAKMMIHDAGALVVGNAADMREVADLLDELSDTIAGIYADRAGGTVETWRAAMGKETWYSADQAVAAGLADRVADGKTSSTASSKASAPEDRRTQLIRARARVHLKEG